MARRSSGILPSLLFCAAAIGALAIAGLVGSNLETWAIGSLINVVFVVALYMFVGNSGVLSFGHMSFAMLGAYLAALLTIPALTKAVVLTNLPGFLAHAEVSSLVSILLAGVLGALVAAVVGIALLRLNGIAAGIASLSLLIIVQVFLAKTPSLTGGSGSTLTGVPATTTIGVALLWAALTIVAAALFQSSSIGSRLRASREDEIAARSIGISVFKERWTSFVVSAFFMSIGGALYVHALGTITVQALYIQYTFLILAMLVIGGIRSLAGAVGGALIVSVISQVIERLEFGDSILGVGVALRPGSRDIALAIIMLAILLLRPAGLIGSRELRWPRLPRRTAGEASSASERPEGAAT